MTGITVTKKLRGLYTSPRMGTFRALESIWRNDPILQTVVKEWKTYRGEARDVNPLSTTMDAAIRLWPMPGPEVFWAPGSQTGMLMVQVEVYVRSYTLEDLDSLFWQMGRAINGGSPEEVQTTRQILKDGGAHTGLVVFSQPAFVTPQEISAEGGLHAVGQVKVEIRNDFQPNPNLPN